MPENSRSVAMAPTLYGLSRSVYTRIARLALEEKGIDYALEEVEIFGASGVPVAHRQRHPFGRIPVLEHSDFMLYETGAITRYVDDAFDGPRLQPADPRRRARMNQVIGIVDSYAYRPMIWPVFIERIVVPRDGGTPDEAKIAAALPGIATCLSALEDLLNTQRFFGGDEITLADLHLAPVLWYFAMTAEGRRMLAGHMALSRWLAALDSRRSVQRTKLPYPV
jgi:glutathione S-transferase